MRKKLTKLILLLFTLHILITVLIAQSELEAKLVVQTGHTRDVDSVMYSADGKILFSKNLNGVKLWDSITGKELRSFPALYFSIDPINKQIASYGSEQFNISIRDWNTGNITKTINVGLMFGAAIDPIKFSPDGKVIATIHSSPNIVKLWDVNSGKQLRLLAGHTSLISSVVFSSDRKTLISKDLFGKEIKIWNWQSGQLIRTIPIRLLPGMPFVISPNGEMIAYATLRQGIKIIEIESGKEIKTLTKKTTNSKESNYRRSIESYRSISFSLDGKLLAAGNSARERRRNPNAGNAEIRFWNLETGEETNAFQVTGGKTISSIAFSSDGKTLAIGNDTKPKIVEIKTGKVIKTMIGNTSQVGAVGLTKDGKLVARGGSDGSIKLWDMDEGRQIQNLTGHLSDIEILAFSKDNKTLASSDKDNTIKLWNLETGKEFKSLLINDPETQQQVEDLVPDYYEEILNFL